MIRFFGDSHTVGAGAKYPARSYVRLIIESLGNPAYENKAIAGNMAYDGSIIIFNTNIVSTDTSFYLIGTNDEAIYKESAIALDAFSKCIKSQYAWLGLSDKVLARSSEVTYTGNWVNSQATNIGKRTDGVTTGGKASFNLTGSVIYINTIITANVSGVMNVLVDGIVKSTINIYANCPTTIKGTTVGTQLLRIDGLSNEQHLVEIVCVSGYAYFEWAGVPAHDAKVYVISPFRKTPNGYEATGGSEYGQRQYWQATKDAVELLAGDGLNIQWIDTYSTINAPADTTTDGVHLSDYGHRVLAEKIISEL